MTTQQTRRPAGRKTKRVKFQTPVKINRKRRRPKRKTVAGLGGMVVSLLGMVVALTQSVLVLIVMILTGLIAILGYFLAEPEPPKQRPAARPGGRSRRKPTATPRGAMRCTSRRADKQQCENTTTDKSGKCYRHRRRATAP